MKKTLNSDYDFKENQDGWFYSEKQPLVRFKFVNDEDPIWGGITTYFYFPLRLLSQNVTAKTHSLFPSVCLHYEFPFFLSN